MKTKKHEKKRKHKKRKHKKEKSKKERKSSSNSESESESEEEEWVDASKKEKRDEWMNDPMSFDDLVPTYGRGEGERKRQRRDKSEAERLLEKKLLEERELNPYLKKDESGLRMRRPDDDNSSFSAPSKSVGDGGYGWLKKAYDRVREQAKKEGRTMEDVAVERWGSLGKLEKMLKEAKERMIENRGSNGSSSRGSEERKSQEHDRSRWRKSSQNYHRSDYRDCSYSDRKSYEREADECRSDRYKDSSNTSGSSRSFSGTDTGYRKSSYDYKKENLRESSYESKRLLMPRDDRDAACASTSAESFRQPAWKKKTFEKESSPFKSNDRYEGSERKHRAESSTHYDSSRQLAWKKNFHKESALPEKRSIIKEEDVDSREEASTSKSKTLDDGDEKVLSKESTSRIESSDSEDGEGARKKSNENIIMNRNELNLLASRAMRAEMWGDFKLANEINEDLEKMRAAREDFEKSGGSVHDGFPRQEVVASAIDCYPLPEKLKKLQRRKGIKAKKVAYVGPFRTQYFDDKLSLQQLFEREKTTTIDDQLKLYVDTAAACKDSVVEDYADDASGKVAKKMSEYPQEEKDIKKAIQDYKRMSSALDKCRFCLDKPALLKHTIVGKGDQVFICAPAYKSLVEGHCFIIPNTHVSSSLLLDEDEFNELQAFKRGLGKMFFDKGQSVVFMETSVNHRYFPHAVIECIPMPKDTADLAPLYFKKAIDEAETEWAHNKKLIDLSKKDLRHSVPKGLPYFCVEFSFGGGFAHVIEDEKSFPKHFGKEIVGGMLEIDSHYILKAKDEPMKDVFKKVLKLVDEYWKYKEYFKC